MLQSCVGFLEHAAQLSCRVVIFNKPFENPYLPFPTWWQRLQDSHSPKTTSMASGFDLPPPAPLDLHNQNAAEKWKKFHLAWTSYSLATELNKTAEPVQVATLLTVIGEEARDVYSTFTDWVAEGDKNKIVPVFMKFAEYCQPRRNQGQPGFWGIRYSGAFSIWYKVYCSLYMGIQYITFFEFQV